MEYQQERLSALAEKLQEEIDDLPEDGKTHELRIVVGRNTGNIAGRNQIIIQRGPEAPTDPDVSRRCYQCRKLTWLATQHCIHCHIDLFAHDAAVRHMQSERRKTRFIIATAVVGFGCLFAYKYLPAEMSSAAMALGTIALVAAMMVSR